VNADYTQKLVGWIGKKKYQCVETDGDSAPDCDGGALDMRIDDVFNFRLKKKAKSELDKVKEQMKILKQDRTYIDMQMKLQNLYFFCFWRD
jgi:hypothetical protein